jgi:hypothetical protein
MDNIDRHDFTEGADLNPNGLQRIANQFASQRMGAQEVLDKLAEATQRHVDFTTPAAPLRMVPIPAEYRDQRLDIAEVDRVTMDRPRVAMVTNEAGAEWYDRIGPVALNAHAHGQLCDWSPIGRKYYRHLLQEAPDLLASNVNHWLTTSNQTRLVRAEAPCEGRLFGQGFIRAWLSDRFRLGLDNIDLAQTIIPVLTDDSSPWVVTQCAITDVRLHIEAICPNLTADIRVGDPVALAAKWTCSEVGAGALNSFFGFRRVVCSNLALVSEWGTKTVHLGGKLDDGLVHILSDHTKALRDETTLSELRDTLDHMADRDRFQNLVSTLQDSAKTELQNPPAASQLLTKNTKLTEAEAEGVTVEMMRSGDPTIWGLTNALTATARDLEYERKAELEKLAGGIMADPRTWKQYAEATAA